MSLRNGESREYDFGQWQAMGYDKNSPFGNPMFIDPENNDHRVKPDSPAHRIGLINFEMGRW